MEADETARIRRTSMVRDEEQQLKEQQLKEQQLKEQQLKEHSANEVSSEDSWVYLDKYRLDEECERQVKLKITYGKILAKQRASCARKKNELKVVMAEVDKEARADPAKFGISKPSEKAYENAVLLDSRVQTLIQEHIEEEFWVGIREAEVYALSDRKSMLEKEVDLFLSGYYASPRPSQDRPRKSGWEQKRDQSMDEAFNPPSNSR